MYTIFRITKYLNSMNELQIKEIKKEVSVLSDADLKTVLYDTICDEGYHRAVAHLLDTITDVEPRRQYAQYLSQKRELLESICRERGIDLKN